MNRVQATPLVFAPIMVDGPVLELLSSVISRQSLTTYDPSGQVRMAW